jgi:pimeloyl-ACP methyl ester carboxylesterase
MLHTAAKAFLLAVLLSSCTAPVTPKKEYPGISLTHCVLTSSASARQVDAKCGSLRVPEDPSHPDGRQIDLNLAVVEAARRHAEPDPLFILMGGPGESATENFAALSSIFEGIHQERDIVLVDQRGTGKSHPLRCLNAKDKGLGEEESIARLKACPARLDADLRFYTTDFAMQDLDRVRAALGYETINLYGVSYGTRAVLVYLKLYPERVRSLVLDAVVDPSFVLYQDAARDGQRSLELLFERCEADPACSSTYPRLRSELTEVLQKVEGAPTVVTISHPATGQPLEVPLTGALLSTHIFNMLYSPDLSAVLPFVIHQAHQNQDYAPLITQGFLVNDRVYDGLFYAVACAEDSPFLQWDQTASGLFDHNLQTFLEICSAWPRGEVPPIVHAPVVSDVPVLMFSGEADPITPPWHAEKLRDFLRNSRDVVFPGMGHGNAASACGMQIMENFVDTVSVNGLDVTCAADVKPPQFFVGFSNPEP